MPAFKTVDQIDVAGKRIVVRADLNVPVKDGRVTDTTRIDRSAQTLKELMSRGGRVIVLSHFGRPDGKRNEKYTLRPVLDPLHRAVGLAVMFGNDCIGPEAEQAVNDLQAGQIALLENLRFHPEEEQNDLEFAKKLAALGDLYVNDAFSTAHRAHASTEAIARLLPAAAGRLMQAELEALGKALEQPEHPVAAVVGGAKISTKLDLLGNMVSKVDLLVIGGSMANTFLFAKGIDVGKSLCEKSMADTARHIMQRAEATGCEIVLPTDAVVADEFKEGAAYSVISVSEIPADKMLLDIGPASTEAVIAKLSSCKTLVWNGPLGAFEVKPFDTATNSVAQAAARLSEDGRILSVAGGGDTVAALVNARVEEKFSYISTAGGAFLEWIEGKTLPGVSALTQ
ncbi:Phosphoglycerate kinase [invertebrate metagenome]|uniref:phosphoglycerate kinase n=1 Tax=invertebrate metagenome TaxID=1711999 RepID=A0A484H8A6_9ZZZZ